MTDLFESLSIRFAPDALPAIRPRPQSRFEDGSSTDIITEEDSFEAALAPAATPGSDPALPDDNDLKRRPGPVPVDRSVDDPVEHYTRRHTDPVSPQGVNQKPDHMPVAAVDKTPASQKFPQHNAPEVSSDTNPKEKHGRAEEHPEHLVAKASDGPVVIREVLPPESSEQHENVLHRIETRVVQAPADPQEPTALSDASQPKTTIRIGRIEMRQSAPPPPAPAPAPPPRRTPPPGSGAMSQGSGRNNSGSGLTDYLGWKRR